MHTIRLAPTATAQWRELVHEAASQCDYQLDDELESYLVFLLMRYVDRPEMAGRVLALDYLESLTCEGGRQQEQLREVGDQCLLYSGLFPLRARRRLVRIRYYVDLGRSAYHQLSGQLQRGWADTFARLAERFVPLTDVLQAMRPDPESTDLLTLHELADECGSSRSRRALFDRFGAALVSSRSRH